MARDISPTLDEKTKDDQSQSSSANSIQNVEDTSFNPGWRFYLAFMSLVVITLMVALDATSLSVALPIMAQALKGSALEAFWAGTSFLLTSTVFQPVLGSFSEIFGRKPILFLSLAKFGAGVIIAALANNFTVILIGRTLQGIGGGGVIVLTEVIVTDLVPLRYRGQWFSFISSSWAIGTVCGPLLGGGFSQSVSWRWIFWINLPFIGIGSLMIIAFLQLKFQRTTLMSKLQRVDWIGMILFIASVTGILLPLTQGGVQYEWSSGKILVPLIVCTISLAVFIVYEEYLERKGAEPLIRMSVMKNRTAAVTYFTTFIHGLLLWCILYYQPFYYEAILDMSPIMTGVALFPSTFTVAPASAIAGIIAAKTNRYVWAVWSGWVLVVLGTGLLILTDLHTHTAVWVVINCIAGIGFGLLFSGMALAVQASSTNKVMAYAVILFAFFRAAGQTVGVAIGGVVFQNVFKQKLLGYPSLAPYASQYSKDSAAMVQIIKAMPASLQKTELLTAYMGGLRAIYIMCTVLSAVALIASLWTESLDLNRALETDQGFHHESKKPDEEARTQNS